MQTNRNIWLWLLLLLLVAGILSLSILIHRQRLQMNLESSTYYNTPQKIMGSAFREVRVTLADILWVKVDHYFHASLTKEEHEMIHPGHAEHMEGHEHQAHPKEPADFLPLIRLITDLQPDFIEAYRTGAWWLDKRMNQTKSAIDYLKEGISKNPKHFELHYDLAWMYYNKLHEYENAKRELLAASSLEMDSRDRSAVLELLAFSYEQLYENPEAISVWKEVKTLGVQPYCTTAERKLKELPEIIRKQVRGIHLVSIG